MIPVKVYSGSDVGLIRKENQDAFFVQQLPNDELFAVVCDGMGGEKKGDVASQLAVKDIWEVFSNLYKNNKSSEKIKNSITTAIYHANNKIFQQASEDETCSGMGTTVVAALINDNIAHIAYVGDSRAYFLSNGSIAQLTKDHSLVQQMCDCGEITKDEMRNHPRKNVITRALGAHESVDIDYIEHPFGEKDKLLICTDGLSNQLTDEEILKLSENDDTDTSVKLISAAKASGGKDNITVVIIEK